MTKKWDRGPGHHEHGHHRDWHHEHEGMKGHHMNGIKGEHHGYPPTAEPEFQEPRLPDESGWYIPSTHKPSHGSRHIMTAGTGALLTSAAVGIFVLALVLILLAAILYRKRRLAARQQRSAAAAQRNLYISGMGYNGPGLDNPTYVVPLNDEEKKVPLCDSLMFVPKDYPALLGDMTGVQPPSYQDVLTNETPGIQPPSYSLEADDNSVAVPVLRRLSITLPEEENAKNEEKC